NLLPLAQICISDSVQRLHGIPAQSVTGKMIRATDRSVPNWPAKFHFESLIAGVHRQYHAMISMIPQKPRMDGLASQPAMKVTGGDLLFIHAAARTSYGIALRTVVSIHSSVSQGTAWPV